MNIVAISAGTGDPSTTRLLTDRLLQAVSSGLASVGVSADVELVELKQLAVDLARATTAGPVSPELDEIIRQVSGADALILATPVFTGSYSGLFKLLFDAMEPTAIAGTPTVLAATGGSARHALVLEHAMRPLASYLRAVSMPTAVYAAPEDWAGAADSDGRGLSARVNRAAGELIEHLTAHARTHGAGGGDPDFTELLRRSAAAS